MEATKKQTKPTTKPVKPYPDFPLSPHKRGWCKKIDGKVRIICGHVEGANIIKLNREEPKVSYLFYPDFDAEAHPPLRESLRLRLSNANVKHLDFAGSENPPVLHRKEDLLPPDDPRRERFARLTRQEEKYGLYDDVARIGTRNGWNDAFRAHAVSIRGHRLYRVRSTPSGEASIQHSDQGTEGSVA